MNEQFWPVPNNFPIKWRGIALLAAAGEVVTEERTDGKNHSGYFVSSLARTFGLKNTGVTGDSARPVFYSIADVQNIKAPILHIN